MGERRLDVRLDLIPTEPGTYLMKDVSGSVMYVGKAVNLRARLASYFCERPQGNAKVLAMIRNIRSFDYVVTANENEALILEANLIKAYAPRYNVLLRDDREYPYLRVTWQEPYPRVMKAFHVGADSADGCRYYGPYPTGELTRALDTLKALFPLKTCRRDLPREIGKERPCLNLHIGRCLGPCTGRVSMDDYRNVIADVCRFLEGRYDGLLQTLKAKRDQAAAALDFEQAALWRDRHRALLALRQTQRIVATGDTCDRDAIAVASGPIETAIVVVEIREGRVVRVVPSFVDGGDDDASVVRAYLLQRYAKAPYVPRELLLPVDLDDAEALASHLSNHAGHAVTLRTPKRGAKADLVAMAQTNADEQLRRRTLVGGGRQTDTDGALAALSTLLHIARPIERIEAYDISHHAGDDTTASLVVFVRGRPERRAYRHFHVQHAAHGDDLAALKEVIERRLGHLGDERFGAPPDVILVDGGAPQVSAVAPLLQGHAIGLAGMVKDGRHRTRGLVLVDGQTVALNEDDPACPDAVRTSRRALWRLITAVQNEAHRVANRLRDQAGTKRRLRWSLDAISGVGPAKRKRLLSCFGSVAGVARASEEQLRAAGIGAKTASAVHQHFHPVDP